MKYKTLFRIMLKVIGVWFTVNAIVTFASALTSIISITYRMRGGSSVDFPYWLSMLSPLVQASLGLHLFFGGKWIVDLAIPSNRPYCHECGYDLTGAVGNVCNECGTPFRAEPAARHE